MSIEEKTIELTLEEVQTCVFYLIRFFREMEESEEKQLYFKGLQQVISGTEDICRSLNIVLK